MNSGMNKEEDSTGFTIQFQYTNQSSISSIITSEPNHVCAKEFKYD